MIVLEHYSKRCCCHTPNVNRVDKITETGAILTSLKQSKQRLNIKSFPEGRAVVLDCVC